MVDIEVYPYCITGCGCPSFKSSGHTTYYPFEDEVVTQTLKCEHARVCKHIEGQAPLNLRAVAKHRAEKLDRPMSAEEMKRAMEDIRLRIEREDSNA